MARNKSIPDDRLIALIHSYFTIECKKDVTKLKFPDITAYITAHGYPDYQVTTLRRTQAAREYIESLKEAEEKTAEVNVAAYKTLDIDEFLENHQPRARLRQALADLDNYYHAVADSAAMILEKGKQYQDRISYLEKELRKLKGIIKQLEEQIETLKEEWKRTGLEKNSLSEYIKTYTYPDIANRLLMDDGLVEEKDNTVDPVRLDKNIIGSGTVINFKEATEAKKKSASAAINSLFEELED